MAPIRQAPLLQLWTGSKVLVPKAKAANASLAKLLREQDVIWSDGTGADWAIIDGIELTAKGTTDLVRALAGAIMPSNVDAIQLTTWNLAKKYGRLSMIRCYMGGQDQHLTDKGTDNDSANASANAIVGTDALTDTTSVGTTTTTTTTYANTDTAARTDPATESASASSTMQSTASATVTKLLDQMTTDFAIFTPSAGADAIIDADAAIAAVNNVMDKLSADSEGELPFVVDQHWAPSPSCRITLCTGPCDAGSEHNNFAVAGDTKLRPGCGHNPDHGLCNLCQPHQDDDTINVCANCKTPCRNPSKNALTLASVTSALTEPTTGGPVGHVKLCCLAESNETGIVLLVKAAVLGSARLDPGEINMLAAAHSPGTAATPQTGDRHRVVDKTDAVRRQLCGPCLHKATIAPDESPASAHDDGSADDVVYVHNHSDIVGLLAAQATAKAGSVRQLLRDKCKTALDQSLMKKADKTFLSRLSTLIADTRTTKTK